MAFTALFSYSICLPMSLESSLLLLWTSLALVAVPEVSLLLVPWGFLRVAT
jgi:hypothetical protein